VTSMLLDLLEESWSADEARCEFSHNNSVCTVQAAAKSVRTCTGDSRLSCRTIVAIHRGEMASMAVPRRARPAAGPPLPLRRHRLA
jgi:hypothetical protein